jgi:hypothetical protein
MRAGAQNNIYVIPAPNILTFGEAMLFSAACCIPALLSLVAFFYQGKESDWMDSQNNTGDPGMDRATIEKAEKTTRKFLKRVDILVFGIAILGILIIGELNFWSVQVKWQTEPIGTVGMC